VVAEGAAELEEIGALAEVQRGESVTERVEAGPEGVNLLSERLEDAAAEVAGVEWASCFAGRRGRSSLDRAGQRNRCGFATSGVGRQTSRRPYLLLGGTIRSRTTARRMQTSGSSASSWRCRRWRAMAIQKSPMPLRWSRTSS
jgi:hypothetical protein